MKAHDIVHVYPGALNPAELLRCDHPDGQVSFRIVDADVQIWLTATVEDFDLFADVIDALAERIRTEETS